MKVNRLNSVYFVAAFVVFTGCANTTRTLDVSSMSDSAYSSWVSSSLSTVLSDCLVGSSACRLKLDPGSRIDSVSVQREQQIVHVYLNKAFSQKTFRDHEILELQERIAGALGSEAAKLDVQVEVLGVPIAELVPNYFRSSNLDVSRMPKEAGSPRRLTTKPSAPWQTAAQLTGRHIAIWPSHGWYYEFRLDRWEWQRARLFETVEDLFPMAFVVPYLAPMLEGAGAYVHIPRERDVQVNEVIVDNDGTGPGTNRFLEVGESQFAWKTSSNTGYLDTKPLLQENPFQEGTYRVSQTDRVASAVTSWIPDIPETGDYAVYVSYGLEENATSDARYTVFHSGGLTEVSVDQRMMGGTWVYLGTYHFSKGSLPEKGRVDLANKSAEVGKVVSADAVRFGGGMGTVERSEKTSGRPRFTEGARYYMQFAGMPDNLVYNVTESSDDYIDDYRGRAEWVNYLKGAPFGPNKDRAAKGLNVPVDISMAFHTDAGITNSSSTIGTLMIYSSTGAQSDRTFPDGMSRFANRDLGDIMQTTIVSDLRAKYDSTWSQRAIWDRDYSEAVRPNVPGVLLELLSHQNFADMKFGLDPRFRFDVARSVYKSMVYFLASQHQYEPVIQPLPVTHMRAEWTSDGKIEVNWKEQLDPSDASAKPSGFVIYQRMGDEGFDGGTFVTEAPFVIENSTPGIVYSFKVRAVNAGGEGMASEEVSAGRPLSERTKAEVLVITGFDRISSPSVIEAGTFKGFSYFDDEGVPDRYDLSFVGHQYDFNAESPWLDDDSPGHGASYATSETKVITGNTFNYASLHGSSILKAGYAFATSSDEAVWDDDVYLNAYGIVDLILGEEKTTKGPGITVDFEAIPEQMQAKIAEFMRNEGSVIISGAYVATDLAGPGANESSRLFANDVLRFSWTTNHAAESGKVGGISFLADLPAFNFNVDPTGPVYRVESPDALRPAEDAKTIIRYSDNNMSAAIGRPGKGGVIVVGFPFETVLGMQVRDLLMNRFLDFVQ